MKTAPSNVSTSSDEGSGCSITASTRVGHPLRPNTLSPTSRSPCVTQPRLAVSTGVELANCLPNWGGIKTMRRMISPLSTASRCSISLRWCVASVRFGRCATQYWLKSSRACRKSWKTCSCSAVSGIGLGLVRNGFCVFDLSVHAGESGRRGRHVNDLFALAFDEILGEPAE